MAFEGPAEPADSDHVLRFKTARDVGAGGPSAGLTDTQLRATPVPVSLPAGTVRTFALVAAVGNGSVSAGAKSVAFSSSSDFAGTITGAAFGASQTTGASADGADTIGAIAYTRTAGTLYIATLT